MVENVEVTPEEVSSEICAMQCEALEGIAEAVAEKVKTGLSWFFAIGVANGQKSQQALAARLMKKFILKRREPGDDPPPG